MRDYRVWWGFFVFFIVVSVFAVQQRYRGWRRATALLETLDPAERSALSRRVRREGWRLVLMVGSIAAMTALVFAALGGAPAALVQALRVAAVGGVVGVLLLGLRR